MNCFTLFVNGTKVPFGAHILNDSCQEIALTNVNAIS